MADATVVLALRRLESMPPVRPAFAAALREELHHELGFASAAPVAAPGALPSAPTLPAPALPGRDRRGTGPRPGDGPTATLLRRALGSLRPLTPRVALILAAALLLLAGTVAAAYLVIHAWISSGPRGAQFTDDFSFAEVYRQPIGALHGNLVLDAAGNLYAVRVSRSWPPDPDPVDPAVVRFDWLADGQLAPRDVFRLEQLLVPAAWDPGTSLAGMGVEEAPTNVVGNQLAVSPRGDLFVAASLYRRPGNLAITTASSVIVLRPNGSWQRVITTADLAAAGLLQWSSSGQVQSAGTLTVAASAADLLWVRAETVVSDGNACQLFEVRDPNGDGDWSDRVVRRLVLPPAVPAVDGAYQWFYRAFVAEGSLPNRDRSRSILLPLSSRSGEYRIYRLTDQAGDGDLTQAGETELIFSLQTQSPSDLPRPLASRVVVESGQTIVDELLIGGLTRETRISRVSSLGVIDIVRGLPSPPQGLAARPTGEIEVVTQEPGNQADPPVEVIYRLTPQRSTP